MSSESELDLPQMHTSTYSSQETKQSEQQDLQPAIVDLPEVRAEQEVELPDEQDVPFLEPLAP